MLGIEITLLIFFLIGEGTFLLMLKVFIEGGLFRYPIKDIQYMFPAKFSRNIYTWLNSPWSSATLLNPLILSAPPLQHKHPAGTSKIAVKNEHTNNFHMGIYGKILFFSFWSVQAKLQYLVKI